MMDPERLHAYLQVACSGLGFDIGEVWWTSSNGSSSSVEAIVGSARGSEGLAFHPTHISGPYSHPKHLRFIQLYTSRCYDDKRNKLVNPSEKLMHRLFDGRKSWDSDLEDDDDPILNDEEAKDVKRHVLSPRLVDSIASTAQVVWANCHKREGLLGRSDMLLQTAVGVPVAMDDHGHMCVVVMFSPSNVRSNDDALDYLEFISKCAMSTSIPCLHPVLKADGNPRDDAEMHSTTKNLSVVKLSKALMPVSPTPPQNLGDGVVARFVSFRDSTMNDAEVRVVHEVTEAPKDTFGIPMLPTRSELCFRRGEQMEMERSGSPSSESSSEAFDEASYGVWSTVMHTLVDHSNEISIKAYSGDGLNMTTGLTENPCYSINPDDNVLVDSGTQRESPVENSSSNCSSAHAFFPPQKLTRLEEFAAAFLGMSVFDVADFWLLSIGNDSRTLVNVTSVTASDSVSENLDEFVRVSSRTSIHLWSGAAGRALGSGNPVWSSNRDVIMDYGRAQVFKRLNVKSALAIPVSFGRIASPVFVICFYSLVRSDSVPFVLRFVQQAVRLVWDGLEKVVPHSGIGQDVWNDVAPADLGEMAADLEMQKAFAAKKRPYEAISDQNENVLPTPVYVPSALFPGDAVGELTSASPESETNNNDRIYQNEGNESTQNMTQNMETNSTYYRQVTVSSVSLNEMEANGSSVDTSNTEKLSSCVQAEERLYERVTSGADQGVVTVSSASLCSLDAIEEPAGDLEKEKTRNEQLLMHEDAFHAAKNNASSVDTWTSSTKRLKLRVLLRPAKGDQKQIMLQPEQQLRRSELQSQEDAVLQTHELMSGQAPLQQLSQEQQTTESMSSTQNQPQHHSVQPSMWESQLEPELQPKRQSDFQQHSQQLQPQPQPQPQPRTLHPHQYQVSHQQQPQCQYTPQAEPLPWSVHAKSEGTKCLMIPAISEPADHGSCPVQPLAPAPYPPTLNRSLPKSRCSLPPLSYKNYSLPKRESRSSLSSGPEKDAADRYNLDEAKANIMVFNAMAQANMTSDVGRTQNGLSDRLKTSHATDTKGTVAPLAAPSILPSFGFEEGQQINVAVPISIPTSTDSNSGKTSATQTPLAPSVRERSSTSAHLTSGRVCRIQGCEDFAIARRPYCLRHSGNRFCEYDGCTKCAQGSTRFCIAHGGGRRCTFPGCDKGARDKYFCAAHGGGKRCRKDGCNKSAVGGSTFCTSHGGGRRCAVDGCSKSAQSSTNFCVKHGGGKKCAHEGCRKVARGRTNYCAAHGGGVRCKLEGCCRVAIGKMQLCRAHGGGSQHKSTAVNKVAPAPTEFTHFIATGHEVGA